jgi:hypothetical protein
VFTFDPDEVSLLAVIEFLEIFKPKVIAVNSVFWPITEMLKLKTLALHFLKSDDGHQFHHNNMYFVTSSKYAFKRIKKANGRGMLIRDQIEFTNSPSSAFIIDFKTNFLKSLSADFLKGPKV